MRWLTENRSITSSPRTPASSSLPSGRLHSYPAMSASDNEALLTPPMINGLSDRDLPRVPGGQAQPQEPLPHRRSPRSRPLAPASGRWGCSRRAPRPLGRRTVATLDTAADQVAESAGEARLPEQPSTTRPHHDVTGLDRGERQTFHDSNHQVIFGGAVRHRGQHARQRLLCSSQVSSHPSSHWPTMRTCTATSLSGLPHESG
jgi:hypothetical protein